MMAVPGFDTGHELDRMGQVLKDGYQLNEVVLVYCLNDVADLMPEVGAAAARLTRTDSSFRCRSERSRS